MRRRWSRRCARGASDERDDGIAAAHLDVVETEPLPETSPLWDLPNCTLTPHDSDTSLLGHGRTTERFLENLVRYVRGEDARGCGRFDGD